MKHRGVLVSGLVPFLAISVALAERPREPLDVSRSLDKEIQAQLVKAGIPASPKADDAEFLRRVYLDVTGQLPSPDTVLAFLADADPGKRAKVIDRLLASPNYGNHLATVWTNLLLSGEVSLSERELFRSWLANRLNEGHGWDRIVHDMLAAEGEPAVAPGVVFTLAQMENNQLQPNLLAAATTRRFLGVQLQCAECHNHPFTSYKQTDFWGVAAFFSKTKTFKDKGKPSFKVTEADLPLAKEKAKGKMPPRGAILLIPSTAGKGAGTAVKAKFLEAPEPELGEIGPFRPALAKWVTAPENPYFARAAANRLWAHLFGRGLVNPVDDMHGDNAASHPELLDLLAGELRSSGFDFKHLLRCLCNSQAYQRTSRPLPGNEEDKELFSHMATKVMSPEVLYDALTASTGWKELNVTTGRAPTGGIGGAKKNAPAKARERFMQFFRTQDPDSMPTDFTHGIPHVLALMNDPQFTRGAPLTEELAKSKVSSEEGVQRLYLTALSRRPTPEESKTLVAYIGRQPNLSQGYAGALWILLNTQEFMLVR